MPAPILCHSGFQLSDLLSKRPIRLWRISGSAISHQSSMSGLENGSAYISLFFQERIFSSISPELQATALNGKIPLQQSDGHMFMEEDCSQIQPFMAASIIIHCLQITKRKLPGIRI